MLVNHQVIALTAAINAAALPKGVGFNFTGEEEDQQESMIFLVSAFGAALFMMFVIQFNTFFRAFVVMSAIVFSVADVLLGLIVIGRPFGVVMGGIGVIALAGIVVNNNIVLIDTYNDLRRQRQPPERGRLAHGCATFAPGDPDFRGNRFGSDADGDWPEPQFLCPRNCVWGTVHPMADRAFLGHRNWFGDYDGPDFGWDPSYADDG